MDGKSILLTNNERESNGEQLRLICMLFIVVHHLLVRGAYPELLLIDESDSGIIAYKALLLNGFTYIGVNCFILLSGYYGIRFKGKKLVSLYLICAFYQLLDGILISCSGEGCFQPYDIMKAFMVFSHSSYWFIPCYFALFCISPVLNIFAASASKRDFSLVLVAMTFVNVYLGCFWGLNLNPNGYNVVHFIYIYLIGRYIGKWLRNIKRTRWFSLSGYILSALLWSIAAMSHKAHMPSFAYNNPFVLMASISFFLFLLSFTFRCKIINWLAGSSLAVYLIQSSRFIGGKVYLAVNILSEKASEMELLVFIVGLSLFITIASIAFDKIRIVLERFFTMCLRKCKPASPVKNIISC